MFGKVANIVASANGCYEASTAPNILVKLEAFLQIIDEQRARRLSRHPELAADAVFDASAMSAAAQARPPSERS